MVQNWHSKPKRHPWNHSVNHFRFLPSLLLPVSSKSLPPQNLPPPSCPLLLLASIERRNRTRQLSSWYRVVFISFLFRVGTDGAHSRHDRVKAFLSWRTRLSVADSGERKKERKRERERERESERERKSSVVWLVSECPSANVCTFLSDTVDWSR